MDRVVIYDKFCEVCGTEKIVDECCVDVFIYCPNHREHEIAFERYCHLGCKMRPHSNKTNNYEWYICMDCFHETFPRCPSCEKTDEDFPNDYYGPYINVNDDGLLVCVHCSHVYSDIPIKEPDCE